MFEVAMKNPAVISPIIDVFKEMFEEDFTIEEFDYISIEINKILKE